MRGVLRKVQEDKPSVDLEDLLDIIHYAHTPEQKAEARRLAEEYLTQWPGAPYVQEALERMEARPEPAA